MRRLGCLLISLFALGGGLLGAFMVWTRHEHPYAERSLESWVQLYQTIDDAESPVQAQQAKDAIVALGTNCLPQLVHWLSYDPLLRRHRVVTLTRALPGPIRRSRLVRPLMLDRDEFRADTAAKVLRIVGPAASPVLVELSGLARQTNSLIASRRALSVLARMNKDGLSPLQAVVTDAGHPNRVFAIDYLGDLGTNALPAVPILVRLLNDSSPAVRARATNTLANLAPQMLGPKPGAKIR